MRPYRALTIDTKRWAYGWYCEVEGKHYIILTDAQLVMIECSTNFGIESFVEVDPKTVGQQIGQIDKNRIECYFGDIIKHETGTIGIIKWSKDRLGICFEWNDGTTSYPVTYADYIDFEVIGNIHSNPKLLEEQK